MTGTTVSVDGNSGLRLKTDLFSWEFQVKNIWPLKCSSGNKMKRENLIFGQNRNGSPCAELPYLWSSYV